MSQPLTKRYLLLTFVPYYVDEGGKLWLERLWHRDFVEHLRYLKHVVLAAPRYPMEEGADLLPVDVPDDVEVTLVPLPKMESTAEAIARIPEIARILWDAVGDAEIVHSGVVGWPYPVGWVGNTIALLRKRNLVLVVESAPWRLSGARNEGAKDRVRAVVTEALARFFVRRADVNLFTQPEYRRTLARPETQGCHVTPATWINVEDIVSQETARASWDEKRGQPVRLLFAARLLSSKGVDLLLEAMAILRERGVAVHVDVIGEGPRRGAVADATLEDDHISLLDPIPYGPRFFSLLRSYHAALVPSLGDEQPRILFDAFAQAVPVIAAATDGIKPYVVENETGWLVPRADARALANALARAAKGGAELERMGMSALATVPRYTHRGMHEQRWRILADAFGV
jgi:glycosyltransferase involved in cell wall biosynthesis